MDIAVKVTEKIAQLVDESAFIVCGNSDYTITFDFDKEWDAFSLKTARFSYGTVYEDVVFEGITCPAPVIIGATIAKVGVTAGDLHTTTPALIRCKASIFCEDGLPKEPTEDVYAQIMKIAEETKEIAQSVRADADSGAFNGEKGDPGYTPLRGTDYWTEADKAEIKSYVDDTILGGAW